MIEPLTPDPSIISIRDLHLFGRQMNNYGVGRPIEYAARRLDANAYKIGLATLRTFPIETPFVNEFHPIDNQNAKSVLLQHRQSPKGAKLLISTLLDDGDSPLELSPGVTLAISRLAHPHKTNLGIHHFTPEIAWSPQAGSESYGIIRFTLPKIT